MAPSLIEPEHDPLATLLSDSLKPSKNPLPSSLLHRSLNEDPHNVSSASGIILNLANGKTIVDACGGAAVVCLGHGNEEVAAAAAEQIKKVSYVHTQAYTTDSAEDLGKLVFDGNPFGLEKAIWVGSGSEAIDTSIKLARQYFFELSQPSRTHFIARRQGYHGTTIGAMSLSSNLPRKVPYQPLLLPNVSHVSPAYAYQYQHPSESSGEYVQRLAQELEDEILRVGRDKVIAFVAETVVGATTGCVPAPEGYFKAIRAVCDRYGVLLLMDEIMSGVGRTGSFFAFEQEGVAPDICTIGKGLGGGYAPIAGVLMNRRIVEGLRSGTGSFNNGYTYQAHPVSTAIALSVQKIVRRDKLVERCTRMGVALESLLKEQLRGCKYVGDIRGRGLFWGVEFVADKATKRPFEPEHGFGVKVQKRAFELGVAVYPGMATVDGKKGDHVLVCPPYTVTEEELGVIVEAARRAIEMESEAYDCAVR